MDGVEVGFQVVVALVGAGRRLVVALDDVAVEDDQLVVYLRREVDRVLRGAALGLGDRLLDLRQPVGERLAQRSQFLVVLPGLLQPGHDVRGLRLDFTHPVQRAVEFLDLFAHGRSEVALLRQVVGGRGDIRVDRHFQRFAVGLLADGETDLVVPGQRREARRSAPVHHAGRALDALAAEVPTEGVQTLRRREAGRGAAAEESREGGDRAGGRRRAGLTGHLPQGVALTVQDLQRDRRLRFFLQVVVDAGGAAEAAAVGLARRVEHRVRHHRFVGQLVERGQVVEHPEGAALGGDDQVLAVHPQAGDRRHREVVLEPLPVGAVVEGDIEPELGSGVEQSLSVGVFADRPGEVGRRDAVRPVGEQFPVLAGVVRAEDVGAEVVLPVAVHRDEDPRRVVRGDLDHIHRAACGHSLGGDLGPGFAPVAGDMDAAVVAAGPQLAGGVLRFLEGEHRVVHLDAGAVSGDGAAGVVLVFRVVRREVGADDAPTLSLVAGHVDHLRGVVEDVRVVGREPDGRVPLEPVVQVARGLSELQLRVVEDLAVLAGLPVHPGDAAAVTAGVDDVRVARIHRDVAALAAADGIPVRHHGEAAARGHRDGAVVLLGAVDPVGPLVVHEDAVDLRGLLVALAGPTLSAVEGDIRAAVVGVDHVHRVLGIDPEVVVVAVGDADALGEGPAAVNGLVETDIQAVHRVLVVRVGEDVDVVPGALAQVRVAVDAVPGLAAVVGAVEAAGFSLGLDEHPDAVGVRRRDRDRGLADEALRGQAAFDARPVVATIGAAVDAAVLAAGDHRPRLPLGAPGAGVEDARVVRVHLDVHHAGALGEVEHLLPGGAAVQGAEDAAVLVRPEDVSERRRVGDIRIGRMDRDGADLAGVPQADVLPGLAGVGGAVDPVAHGDVAARAGRPGSDIDHIRVGGRHRDRAHGAHAEETVGHIRPVVAGVPGLVHAAAGAAEVVGQRIAGDPDRRGGAAAAGEADGAELHPFGVLGRDGDIRLVEVFVVVAVAALRERGGRGGEEGRGGDGGEGRNRPEEAMDHRKLSREGVAGWIGGETEGETGETEHHIRVAVGDSGDASGLARAAGTGSRKATTSSRPCASRAAMTTRSTPSATPEQRGSPPIRPVSEPLSEPPSERAARKRGSGTTGGRPARRRASFSAAKRRRCSAGSDNSS